MDVPIRHATGRNARRVRLAALGAVLALVGFAAYRAVTPGDSAEPRSSDPIAELQRRLDAGDAALRFEARHGYLRSLLDALGVPVESQMLVYSKTSLQRRRIHPGNPRAIYFNDDVAVAWVPGGFIEIAAFDPERGAQFWVLEQSERASPDFSRDERCAGCHRSNEALGTNGFLIRSIPTSIGGDTLPWLGNAVPDHGTPMAERFGGWYVTGDPGTIRHLGNLQLLDPRAAALPPAAPAVLEQLGGGLDTSKYPSPYSDVVALLVFEHQIRVMNLLLRLREESGTASAGDSDASGADSSGPYGASPDEPSFDELVDDTVDYMLFVDEAELGAVRGTSGFAERFSALGPRRYPLSYMIQSAAFDGLPAIARDAVYARLWQVLSGVDSDPRYARLGRADREAIIEILVDRQAGLPGFFNLEEVSRDGPTRL